MYARESEKGDASASKTSKTGLPPFFVIKGLLGASANLKQTHAAYKNPEKHCTLNGFMLHSCSRCMKEELAPNEDIIFAQQNHKVVLGRGNVENKPRQLVSAVSLIFLHLLPLAALNLWLLRLLGYISLPW